MNEMIRTIWSQHSDPNAKIYYMVYCDDATGDNTDLHFGLNEWDKLMIWLNECAFKEWEFQVYLETWTSGEPEFPNRENCIHIAELDLLKYAQKIQKVYWYDDGVSEEHGDDNDGYLFGIYRYNDYEHDPIPNDAEWFKTEEERDISFSKEMK